MLHIGGRWCAEYGSLLETGTVEKLKEKETGSVSGNICGTLPVCTILHCAAVVIVIRISFMPSEVIVVS